MLALQGNTAPICSMRWCALPGSLQRGDPDVAADQLQFSEPQEWALVRELLKFDAVIAEVEEELLPNRFAAICSTQPGVQPLLRPGARAQGRR